MAYSDVRSKQIITKIYATRRHSEVCPPRRHSSTTVL